MYQFLNGVAATSCWGAAFFFLRFWKTTRDRFFLLFALAFCTLSIAWVLPSVWAPTEETRPLVYSTRLAAFLLIIAAIWDKNRHR